MQFLLLLKFVNTGRSQVIYFNALNKNLYSTFSGSTFSFPEMGF